MPLPWMQRRPASMTSHLELSTMIGMRAMSGSLAIRFRKRTMAALLSSMASSMLMSITCAPFSTCWRATASASSNCPFRIIRAKALEPVTLVRSPMLTKSVPAPICTGSRPDSFMGGTETCEASGASGAAGTLDIGLTCASLGSGERRCDHPKPDSRRKPAAATLLGRAVILRGLCLPGGGTWQSEDAVESPVEDEGVDQEEQHQPDIEQQGLPERDVEPPRRQRHEQRDE